MLCFHCTDIYVKFFDNFHFQPNTILIIGILKFTFCRHFFSFGKKGLFSSSILNICLNKPNDFTRDISIQELKLTKMCSCSKRHVFYLKKTIRKISTLNWFENKYSVNSDVIYCQ